MTKKKKGNIKNRNKISKKDLSNKRKIRKNKWVRLLVLLGIFVAVLFLIFNPFLPNKNQTSNRIELKFTKEGELSFFDKQNDEIITTIDIEIAEDDYERSLGLMYRYSMSDSIGMLFIMEEEVPQSFWMKDTYISLDIMYLNKDFEIVKIQKYTQPFSEQSIPSIEKAKYVIEVVGGFCDTKNINEGDFVKYERTTAYNKLGIKAQLSQEKRQ
jgi:uncharacterized protein